MGEQVWIDPDCCGPMDGEAKVTEDCGLGYFVAQGDSEWFVTDDEVSPLMRV